MTSYQCINVRCRDIEKIRKSVCTCLNELRIYDRLKGVDRLVAEVTGKRLPFSLYHSKIYILPCDDLEYTAVVAEAHIITTQLAAKLSRLISDVCIYSAFINEMFEIYMYKNGRCILKIIKNQNKCSCKVHDNALQFIKSDKLENALAESSIFDSFFLHGRYI